MLPLLYLIIGALVWHLFKRQILTIAAWLALFAVLYGFARAAPSLGLPGGWMLTAYGASVVGFFVGGLVALRPVINYLVERDFEREVERARGNADKRRV
jgi:hypothetical protein